MLGRHAPEWHNRLFVGDQSAREQLATFDKQFHQKRHRVAESGATETALNEFDRQHEPKRQLLELKVQLARANHARRLFSQAFAGILAVAVVLVVERSVKRTHYYKRLKTARHALMAVWMTVMIAGPLTQELPVVFTALLILIVLAAPLIPAGSPRTHQH